MACGSYGKDSWRVMVRTYGELWLGLAASYFYGLWRVMVRTAGELWLGLAASYFYDFFYGLW